MSEEMKVKSKLNKKIIIAVAGVIVLALALVLAITVPKRAEAKQLAEQLDLGEKYLSELDYEQAVAAYLKAIEIDPKCEDAYLALAGIYIATGELEKADEILKKAEKELGGATEKVKEKMEEAEEAKREAEITPEPTPTNTPVPTATNIPTSEPEDTPTPASTPEPTPTDTSDAEQIQITVRRTDIQADGVFNDDGYGSLTINGVGNQWTLNPDSTVIPPQSALIDANGNFVFPYKSTYLRYRVSDGVVSLTETSPYYWSEELPAYYNLDGSSVFAPESIQNETEADSINGGPMWDGYALVVTGRYIGSEHHSYIVDKSGTIICTLPEDFNEEIAGGDIGFDTKYSLGWCGEDLFAVFEKSYDEYFNFSAEAKGYMDFAGNMVLDLSGHGFTDLWPFHEGLAAVQSESGMIGFIDKTGALVISCIYEGFNASFSEDGICAVQKDGKWGYIGKDGTVVIPLEYDGAYGAGGGLASVVKDGKCGLVDYSNRVIVPLEYDDISSCEGGTAYAIKDGVLYIISKLQ